MLHFCCSQIAHTSYVLAIPQRAKKACLLHSLALDLITADGLRLLAVGAGLRIVQGGWPVIHLQIRDPIESRQAHAVVLSILIYIPLLPAPSQQCACIKAIDRPIPSGSAKIGALHALLCKELSICLNRVPASPFGVD